MMKEDADRDSFEIKKSEDKITEIDDATVRKFIESIVNNKKPKGSGKAGIFWHTQGSGKSFSMVMLTQRLLKNEKLNVPTIVVLTDRIDLDDQLYKTFLGFAGTPVSNKDKQTSDVYGDVIDIYDMTQSIIDGSTVKLYYEARLAKIWANDKVLDQMQDLLILQVN